MLDIVWFIIVMFAPVLLTIPYLLLFLIGTVSEKNLKKYYIIIEIVIVLITAFVFIIQADSPIHINL